MPFAGTSALHFLIPFYLVIGKTYFSRTYCSSQKRSDELTLDDVEAIGTAASAWRRVHVQNTHTALTAQVPVGYR